MRPVSGATPRPARRRRRSHGTIPKGPSYKRPRPSIPSTRALALRHDPALRRADLWDRPPGWSRFDLGRVPDLGFTVETGQNATEINSLRPFADLPIRPMRPFVLKADADDSARAQQCLSQAIYYEAAREPLRGQQAVAQVVLNRVRHPAYPKSICGVVYQERGAAHRLPVPPPPARRILRCAGRPAGDPKRPVQDMARRALAGYVDKDVGSATHYHAQYVSPYWAPTLVKMTQVGQHIFYRWTGPWGEPPAFTGRYAGREDELSPELLASLDPRTQGLLAPQAQGIPAERKITLAVAGEVRTYNVVDPGAPNGDALRRDRRHLRAYTCSTPGGPAHQRQPGGDGKGHGPWPIGGPAHRAKKRRQDHKRACEQRGLNIRSSRRRQGRAGAESYQTPIFSASWRLSGWWARRWSSSARKRTASSAAMQPMPAAVTAWR